MTSIPADDGRCINEPGLYESAAGELDDSQFDSFSHHKEHLTTLLKAQQQFNPAPVKHDGPGTLHERLRLK